LAAEAVFVAEITWRRLAGDAVNRYDIAGSPEGR
jgi:hypothetical protein